MSVSSPNSRLARTAVDADEAEIRGKARREDTLRDAKVTQIADQPGTGSRPARRTRNRTRNY